MSEFSESVFLATLAYISIWFLIKDSKFLETNTALKLVSIMIICQIVFAIV